MKKMNLDFGGGYNTILFSIRENRFFSYEQQVEEIHQLFGGKQYYSSRTGMSGAGFIEPGPETDLVRFGYYRTDASGEQKLATVHTVGDKSIFGYAPIISHGGIDDRAPFVLTDGRKVAFVPAHAVRDTLLAWTSLEGKKFDVPYYDSYGTFHSVEVELYNPHHYRGVRVTRFVDLRAAREAADGAVFGGTMFDTKLNIMVSADGWFHLSVDGYLDIYWGGDPRNIQAEIVAGWIGAGDGLFWRRRREDVEVFAEVERSSINDGKYVVAGETSQWLDYEENFSVLQWFSQDVSAWKEYFLAKLTAKARQDYVYARTRAGIDTRRLMEQNPDVRICVQDSLDTGNCRPGTEEFVRRYEIETDEDGCASVASLLENPSIDVMLRNFYFQKVIHHKLVDPEKEIPTIGDAPAAESEPKTEE